MAEPTDDTNSPEDDATAFAQRAIKQSFESDGDNGEPRKDSEQSKPSEKNGQESGEEEPEVLGPDDTDLVVGKSDH